MVAYQYRRGPVAEEKSKTSPGRNLFKPAHAHSLQFTQEWFEQCDAAFVERMREVHPDRQIEFTRRRYVQQGD